VKCTRGVFTQNIAISNVGAILTMVRQSTQTVHKIRPGRSKIALVRLITTSTQVRTLGSLGGCSSGI